MTSQSIERMLSDAAKITVITRGGQTLELWSVATENRDAVKARLEEISLQQIPEVQLSAIKRTGNHQLDLFLVFDAATSRHVADMMVVSEEQMDVAEVAIDMTPELKGRGVGWALVRYAAALAARHGARRIRWIQIWQGQPVTEVKPPLLFDLCETGGVTTLELVEAELC